jgi:hypothetical protein
MLSAGTPFPFIGDDVPVIRVAKRHGCPSLSSSKLIIARTHAAQLVEWLSGLEMLVVAHEGFELLPSPMLSRFRQNIVIGLRARQLTDVKPASHCRPIFLAHD